MRQGFPVAMRGMTVGLLGGSFDPAHAGHVHITREALRRFGLDRVWWLVSPGNPLKPRQPAPMAERLARARALMRHPRVVITDLEARLGTRYTAAAIRALQARYPGVRFVWLMGADNLVQFHRWDRWQDIMDRVPVGVLARPGWAIRGMLAPAARFYGPERIPAGRAHDLGHLPSPVWTLVNIPLSDLSSSAIRARGEWGELSIWARSKAHVA
ncbi:MAG: nicotinate-nucleotide adenylyltransferase [Gemmobacter sp.]|jgi:nicotinate-nucleotide adenylyltransferase|nr:nicotinate-nucleotide adenylyltransferase [Gemmobacter sp.]